MSVLLGFCFLCVHILSGAKGPLIGIMLTMVLVPFLVSCWPCAPLYHHSPRSVNGYINAYKIHTKA